MELGAGDETLLGLGIEVDALLPRRLGLNQNHNKYAMWMDREGLSVQVESASRLGLNQNHNT